jgi:hypothetical protein
MARRLDTIFEFENELVRWRPINEFAGSPAVQVVRAWQTNLRLWSLFFTPELFS